MDVMLAVGIVFVVMGHRYQPEHLFFPAYTFHMGLFFFISGYLATVREGFRAKLRFVAQKSRTQLLPYYGYNLFFGLVTWLLAQRGLILGYQVPAFGSFDQALRSVRDFLVVPFLDGHHYHLYLAAWFLLQLYLVHVVFQLLCWSASRTWARLLLAATVPVTLLLLHEGLQEYEDLRLTGVRTSFAFLFFLLGYVVKVEGPRLRRLLLAPATLVVAFAAVNVLAIQFGNIRYNIVLGHIGNERVWVPVTTTLLIVVMVFQLTHHLAALVGSRSLLLTIGRSTRDIVIWHFSVFFLVNLGLYAAGLVTFEQLGDNWFILDPKRTWLLYEIPALLLPIWGARWVRRALGALPAPWRPRPTRP